jgi:protein-S-isoprenylcysteine O-methyltransferase Ste14
MPTYYIMDLEKGVAATVAEHKPLPAQVAACKWMTEADPSWFTLSLSTVGFAISIWARLSLGRNIGFVPAQRQIVDSGIYRYLRHTIYTGNVLSIIADDLAGFTWRNVALDATLISLFIIKSFVEESFLSHSTEYQA